jgi:DNA-binding beta-propeller fold protein YncE
MALQFDGCINLPPHLKKGGFDHAAVHGGTGRVYVAHTANDAVDMIDGSTRRYVGSVQDLPSVAGALVSEEDGLVFTSNRGEDTVGIFSSTGDGKVTKVGVGVYPNGRAYDPGRHRLLVANVGNPAIPGSFTVSIVDVAQEARITDVRVSGRTRWTVFDPEAEVFYVNIADPAEIVVVGGENPVEAQRIAAIPSAGPHGLELDAATRQLFCACDGKQVVGVDADSGEITSQVEIGGAPDVIFFNASLRRLYVAIGDPGLIEVVDTDTMRRCETVRTEKGAHTLAFHAVSNTLYALLPETHRAAVYMDCS